MKTIDEINHWMYTLFPNEDLRKYMWQHLASVCIGGNKPQTFNIYTGSGRNGKSRLVDFMGMVFGDYKYTCNSTLVTSKRQQIGGSSSEIAKLKGIRYAVMQEPSKGDQLNDGVMKELTGEDPIQARPLYREPIVFVPQFKLVVSTNSLFDIKTNDNGTWRRIRKVDFESIFVREPAPTEDEPYQFKIDTEMDKKFNKWKHVFMAMLIETACETMGNVEDCEKVKEASNSYRSSQDYYAEFISEKVRKATDKDRIKKTELYEEFKVWFNTNHGKNVPKGRDLYEKFDKKFGKYKNGWCGYTIIYDEDECEVEDELHESD